MAWSLMLKAFCKKRTKTYAFKAKRLEDTRKFDDADDMAAAGF